ncbi:short chain dehydrogenase/reductase family oxidoreductase [Gloeomargarita lithophora Alchichica-D10]|uniref:Short chain dehydrogenase/reductase family oxidoreductase n=1 Tax=Gloeomargarita lithophora Alchichica-D10 TaxID=1188229 RepID=A0A1J0A991_9CYAN|nr:SDR family NAD(P)-dependent oxidoreductase [Gloeomargarita lithophora]APB32499.1 short chain dehydrogenase/reductase family oxidoreductase [Gloeomargarita lithophora Alchichica-D10]
MLAGETVLVTGASSGIGWECAQVLADLGVRLLLVARRQERLENLAQELQTNYKIPCLPQALDVRDRLGVQAWFQNLPPEWQCIDVVINNAGLSRGLDKLYEGDIDDWEEMIDTNLKGLLYITRTVLPGMIHRGRGHVVNIGSIAGLAAYPGGNVYCATKAAVRILGDALKQDLLGTPVRVTTINPGLVATEFSPVRFHGDMERAQQVYQGLTPLTGRDVAETVAFCLTRPPHVNIQELTLLPTDQANALLVHRRE